MPFESQFPSPPIPDVDLWTFLFERKDKDFSDDKGMHATPLLVVCKQLLMFIVSDLL